jgi:hypothetical protein
MSRTIRVFATGALLVCASIISPAAEKPAKSPAAENKWTVAGKNYIAALSDANEGVRISAAEFLGRYQLKESTDALIQSLQTDKSERVRMTAAFALLQLHEERGLKAVEEASLYDGSDKVNAFCMRLLNQPDSQSYTISTDY